MFVFLVCLVVLTSLYLYWGFTRLTADNRQVFACLPKSVMGLDSFQGVNFTWYGLLTANSVGAGMCLYLILTGALGVSLKANLLLIVLLLSLILPSARWIARIVENKKHTFTIGGSVFFGIIISPWVIALWNGVLGSYQHFPVIDTLAALSIAYALGESLGRLSCISFGCCYGKPLSECHPMLQRLFENRAFVYRGTTRKACYASHLEGVKLLPIQAVTAVIYALAAFVGVILFSYGLAAAALLFTLAVTQIWRSVSEMFRADYRGEGKLSVYQIMGLVAVVYSVVITLVFTHSKSFAFDIHLGLSCLWAPGVILLIQAIWFFVFAYMGKSTVTTSTLTIYVEKNNI